MSPRRPKISYLATSALSLLAMLLTGCAANPNLTETVQSSSGVSDALPTKTTSLGSQILESLGLKSPEISDVQSIPDTALPDWRVNLRVATSPSLNVDERGQSLSVVLKVFRLKSADTFLRMPQEAFGDTAREKELLGEDLVSSRELQLLPNQVIESREKVSRTAKYIGIVALLRNPAPQRWRYAFETSSAARTGITIGVHACVMTAQQGTPIGVSNEQQARAADTPCP